MMREWATVVAWNNGIATLRCNRHASCSACQSRLSCGINIINSASSNQLIEFNLPVKQRLNVGQRVELGISEANLLYSALLIYLVPLLGLFIGAGVCHLAIGSNIAVMIGAALGGIAGFLLAKRYVIRFEKKRLYQPVILRISHPTETY